MSTFKTPVAAGRKPILRPRVEVVEKPPKPDLPKGQKNSLEIPTALVFRKTCDGFEAKLVITNVSYQSMCYRVRSSAPERYRISPAMSCIGAGNSHQVSVSTDPKLKDLSFGQMKEDFFDLDASPMPITSTNQSSLLSFWKKNAEGKLVEHYRVEHVFHLSPNGSLPADFVAMSAVQDFAKPKDGQLTEELESGGAGNPLADMDPLLKLMEWANDVLNDDDEFDIGEELVRANNQLRQILIFFFLFLIMAASFVFYVRS